MDNKAIFFDFDGVLTVDTTGSLTTCKYLSQAAGIPLQDVLSAYRTFNPALTLGNSTHEAVWPDFCRLLGRKIDFGLLEKAFDSTPMNEGMVELAGEAKSKNLKVGIITENKSDRMNFLIQKKGLDRIFHSIQISARLGCGKDSTFIFAEAMRETGALPENCVFIDNHEENFRRPLLLGMKTIFHDDERNDIMKMRMELRRIGFL